VDPELRRFILMCIPSVPYLEALLLLRNEPERAWDVQTVARRLYIDQQRAGEVLQSLASAGFATGHPEEGGVRYVYGPEAPEMRSSVDALAAAYARDLRGVTNLVHSRADGRALRFADAFRLRGKEK
jgi:predicted transcriptional regulator